MDHNYCIFRNIVYNESINRIEFSLLRYGFSLVEYYFFLYIDLAFYLYWLQLIEDVTKYGNMLSIKETDSKNVDVDESTIIILVTDFQLEVNLEARQLLENSLTASWKSI